MTHGKRGPLYLGLEIGLPVVLGFSFPGWDGPCSLHIRFGDAGLPSVTCGLLKRAFAWVHAVTFLENCCSPGSHTGK